MSAGFWWVFVRLSQEHAADVAPRFRTAVQSVQFDEWTQRALAAWRADVSSILPPAGAHANLFDSFNAAFRPREMFPLWTSVLGGGVPAGFELGDDNCQIIMNDRVPPAAIVAYAFGPRWLSHMPGSYLQCIAAAAEVPALARRVRRLFRLGSRQEEVLARGRAWGRLSNRGERLLSELFTVFPAAAERAVDERKALAVLTLSPSW